MKSNESLTFYTLRKLVLPLALTYLIVLGVIFAINFFFPETLDYDWKSVLAVWVVMMIPRWIGLGRTQ